MLPFISFRILRYNLKQCIHFFSKSKARAHGSKNYYDNQEAFYAESRIFCFEQLLLCCNSVGQNRLAREQRQQVICKGSISDIGQEVLSRNPFRSTYDQKALHKGNHNTWWSSWKVSALTAVFLENKTGKPFINWNLGQVIPICSY